MEYVGNTYGKTELESSDLIGEVTAQCFCGDQSCTDKGCTWN